MRTEKQKTILLVDDEAIIAMTGKMALEKCGYKVIIANSGEEAVKAVAKTPAIDLILMDINLGAGIDGAEAAEIILRDHDIPIMFWSSHTEPEFVARAEKITAYGYIVKNSSDTVFQALIRMVFKLYESKKKEWKKGSPEEPALKALQESREKYRILIENSRDIIFTLSTEGVFTFVSPAWTTLLGYPLDQVVGKSFREFVHPDDLAACMAMIQKMIATGQRQDGIGAYRVRHIDGSWRWHVTNAVPIRDASGTIIGGEGIARDITESRQAEVDSRENNSRLELALQAADMAWWEMDLTTGNVIFDKRKAEMLDFPPEKFNHYKDFITLVHPEDQERAMAAMRGHIEGSLARYEVEYRISSRSGEFKWFHDIGSVVKKDASGKPLKVAGLVINITRRKQAEKLAEALYEISQSSNSTGNLNELFKHVHRALSKIIPTNNLFIALISDDGKVLDFPYNIDEKDSGLGSAIKLDNAQSLTVEVCKTKKHLLLNETELFERYASGRNKVWGTAPKCWLGVPLMVKGAVIGVLAVQDYHNGSAYKRKDVTLLESAAGQIAIAIERKQAERELKESKALIDAVVENVPLMIFLKEAADLRFIVFNRAGEELLGYDRMALLGKNNLDLFPPEQAAQFMTKDREVLDGEIGMLDIPEEPILTAGKGTRLLHTRKVCIRGADGTTKYLLGISEDITERNQAEKEIKRQLAEKEILLKEVHHRIKNNIAAIGGLISLRLKSITNPEAITVLQDAIGRIDSMRILYDKLLLSDDYKDIFVKSYVDSLIDTIGTLFPDKAKIKFSKQIADFQLDPKRLFPLGIIINELITNKMKYAFTGRDAGKIIISLTKDDKHVKLTIQDDGNGLPDGFDINASKGFGLMLVKMLSQQLGGSFSMEKQKGTRCVVEFDI